MLPLVFSSPFTLFIPFTREIKSFRLNSTLVSLFQYVANKCNFQRKAPAPNALDQIMLQDQTT